MSTSTCRFLVVVFVLSGLASPSLPTYAQATFSAYAESGAKLISLAPGLTFSVTNSGSTSGTGQGDFLVFNNSLLAWSLASGTAAVNKTVQKGQKTTAGNIIVHNPTTSNLSFVWEGYTTLNLFVAGNCSDDEAGATGFASTALHSQFFSNSKAITLLTPEHDFSHSNGPQQFTESVGPNQDVTISVSADASGVAKAVECPEASSLVLSAAGAIPLVFMGYRRRQHHLKQLSRA